MDVINEFKTKVIDAEDVSKDGILQNSQGAHKDSNLVLTYQKMFFDVPLCGRNATRIQILRHFYTSLRKG